MCTQSIYKMSVFYCFVTLNMLCFADVYVDIMHDNIPLSTTARVNWMGRIAGNEGNN